MNKKLFVLMSCIAVASQAWGDPTPTVDILRLGSGKTTSDYGWTGEVWLRTSGLSNVAPGEFASFCIERLENVTVGSRNDASISDEALRGGGNEGTKGPSGGDPLSPATAWLYDRYLHGALGSGNTVAKNVQLAIWYLEDEIDSLSSWATAADYADQAQNSAWAQSGFMGGYRVLNVWKLGTYPPGEYFLQDFIVKVVPVPGACLLGLLGLGSAGLKLRRRV